MVDRVVAVAAGVEEQAATSAPLSTHPVTASASHRRRLMAAGCPTPRGITKRDTLQRPARYPAPLR